MAALDWFMLARFSEVGALDRSELIDEAKRAAGRRNAAAVTQHVVDNWWAFAVRRGLLELSKDDELAALSEDGRARLRLTTDDEYGTGAIKFYGRLAKGGLPLLISSAALIVAATAQAEKQTVLISILAGVLAIGVLFALAIPPVLLLAAGVRHSRRKKHLGTLAKDVTLPVLRDPEPEQSELTAGARATS